MEDILHLCSASRPPALPSSLPTSRNAHLRPRHHLVLLHHPKAAAAATRLLLPSRPITTATPTPKLPTLPPPEEEEDGEPNSPFRHKVIFLASLGLDFLSLAAPHPALLSTPLDDLKSTARFLTRTLRLPPSDLRRACGMCPEILTTRPSSLAAVVIFLLREAGVDPFSLRRAIHQRPRLLVLDVPTRLRPTLRFLRQLGIADTGRHASLLSCSVEEGLLPRIEFLKGVGFAPRDARAMVRRFPDLFRYSVEGNLEPKFDFYAMEMGRDLGELREFPEYFSYSLAGRIRPRHRMCREKGVAMPLPEMLRPGDEAFGARLEVCVGSSGPVARSPLWREKSTTRRSRRSSSSLRSLR